MQHWLPAVPDCIETYKYSLLLVCIWEDFQTKSFKLHIFCNWSQILCYVMLTRVFSARQYKILNVPLSSHLAANHFNQQQAEQEERMRMKKLTLDINERQEQEDYQGTTPRLSFTLFTVAQEAACEAFSVRHRIRGLLIEVSSVCVAEMMQSLAQRPAPANTNRERRPRYQHPKGAPNADLIFKTGGRWDASRDHWSANTQTDRRMCRM